MNGDRCTTDRKHYRWSSIDSEHVLLLPEGDLLVDTATWTWTALPLGIRRDERCSCAACCWAVGRLPPGVLGKRKERTDSEWDFQKREDILDGDRGTEGSSETSTVHLTNAATATQNRVKALHATNTNKAVTFHPAVTANSFWVARSCWPLHVITATLYPPHPFLSCSVLHRRQPAQP